VGVGTATGATAGAGTTTGGTAATQDEAGRLAFWAAQAARLEWETPWQTVHSFQKATPQADGTLSIPAIEWFAGGTLNVAANCVDRHVSAGRGDRVALHFEGEPGDRRTVTYADLQDEVSRAANALLALGIGKGDRVVVYLPVLVETVVVTLACARIGAVHSLVFGGFSAEAPRTRRIRDGTSRSSNATASRATTRRRPWCARSWAGSLTASRPPTTSRASACSARSVKR